MSASKLRLDIPLILPGEAQACERCRAALTEALANADGVEQAHVIKRDKGAGELCIHYDPEQLTLEQIRALASRAGAELTERFAHRVWRLSGADHARAASRVAADLRALRGVMRAEVAPGGAALVEYDRSEIGDEALKLAVRQAGAEVVEDLSATEAPAPGERAAEAEHQHTHGGVFGEHTELVFSLGAGAFLLVGWLLEGPAPVWALVCFIAAYALGSYFTLLEAADNLRHRRFQIDTLMLVAAAGAAFLGAWAEGALLLFLFSLGHALEGFAMGRARRAIEALARLAPDRAAVRRNGAVEDIAVEALRVGDVALVKPNERLPADGFVIAGESSVNQAPVTGESIPVDKRPIAGPAEALDFSRAPAEHRVYAGTINGVSALDVWVARLASQSTLAHVVRLVAEAEASRSPTQKFTERFERTFVPAVLTLVGALMFAWIIIDEPFSASFYRAMAVLVAASPCALAISVPSAVLSGVARAARGGVLVKGGAPLEALGKVSAIAFDKTGTLTEGKPRLTDVKPALGVDEEELLAVAVAIERSSDHPLAAAITRDGAKKLGDTSVPEAEAVESITGKGIQGSIDGALVQIGKPGLFEDSAAPLPSELRLTVSNLEASGRTVMVVRRGARYLGALGVMDTERKAAKETVRRLRGLGVKRVLMLSGDNQRVADAVAANIGLDHAYGGLMPDEKVAVINTLRAEAGGVAMIGDGVNDAPALANANVGVAMGAAGSDVALETADVALMADDLNHLPFAVGLSRRTTRVIRQNLWVSLGVVAVLIPSTILGLKIGAAIIFHEGSTLLVVVNALRLLAYNPPAEPPPAGADAEVAADTLFKLRDHET